MSKLLSIQKHLMLIIGVVLCVLSQLHATELKSYPITTLINAKWGQTPLYLEVGEYIADENPGVFWDFIKGLTELDTPLGDYDTESNQYHATMSVVRTRISAMQIPLLKLIVAMHSLTPRIQTHFQIAEEVLSGNDCQPSAGGFFAQVGSRVACDFHGMRELIDSNRPFLDHPVETYSFDHIFPGTENNSHTVVLYGDMGSQEFKRYHEYLVNESIDGKIRYVLRHYLHSKKPQRRVRLSGYGVELHLKSTEYKSQDDSTKVADGKGNETSDLSGDSEVMGFDFNVLKARFPALSRPLDQLRVSLQQGNEEIAQLKAWEFQDLGLQATAAIAEIQGDEALQILQYTAQNFPQQARTLLGFAVKPELREEVKHNTEVFGRSLSVVPPDGALLVNGLLFDPETFDLNSLVETLRSETRVLESLHANNVRGSVVSNLLALDLSAASSRDFAVDIRDTAIMWINDIETEAQYRRWPGSVTDLLRPTFPGMLRNVRKNLFNLVLVVDPLAPRGRSLIKLAESFVIHQAPVRLGLVFDGRRQSLSDEGAFQAMVCAFNYVTQKKSARSALSFLTDVFTAVSDSEFVQSKHIRNQLRKTFDSLSNDKIADIIDKDSDYDYGRQLAEEFVERLGFKDSPQALLNGVPMPGQVVGGDNDNDFEEAIFSQVMQQTSVLQKAVYRGDLTDNENVIDYLMNQPHVMPRLNQRILSDDEARFIDLSGQPHLDLTNARGLAQLSNRDMTATLTNNIKYFSGRSSSERIGEADVHFLTLWVFGDLETASGSELLLNALLYTKAGGSVRLAFIPNVEGMEVSRPDNLNRLVWAASQTLPGPEALDVVVQWLKAAPGTKRKIPPALNDILASTELHMKMLRVYAQRVLGLGPADRLIVANGKLVGPLQPEEHFIMDDFGLIDRFNALLYGDKIRKVLRQSPADDTEVDITSDILLKLYTSLVPRDSKVRHKIPDDVREVHSVVRLPPKNSNLPHLDVAAIIDPASRSAQKLAPILSLMRNILNCKMRVYLVPVAQHSDMPVKNFYRYVVEPEVQFLHNGQMAEGPLAKFSGVPANPLLTQNLQVPENWLVEVVRSVYDLDNIKLSEIGGPVHSEHELEYLLLEGHCFDSHGTPPRGLQVTLGSRSQSGLVDTIVMANLGYFQLKANPGVWELRLREGKSNDIYDIALAEGPNTEHRNRSARVVISSLRSHVIKLRVAKKAGMQQADLLADDDDSAPSGIWNSIASSFGAGDSGSSDRSGGSDDDSGTINIFSVASGHLYERLLRIMMVSLLKHTKTPVKFWFLKNYLSPQFTDFLPHMARRYSFQYELVQYKWPRWLHQQTEKQRTIWGYKILFLDVLFPLNVRKIIFVDADAIVRTDLKELYDMDLGGAPYAYTPFCDSRKEMEGFRFWKQGYWRSHLMGRRYHISALYVVDLRRFRRIAAGDRLRGQYQALSQDPNSLANLDQDLPNNMIHQVAIKSLPDEWLWCETWCSNTSFKKAKVIDLCNNPMTKEAKLTAAQRIVPEWKDYDAEIKKLMSDIEDHENNDHDPLSTSAITASDSATKEEGSGFNFEAKLEALKHSEL